MRVLITGAAGLVGHAVRANCPAGNNVIGFDHQSLDITDELKVNNAFERERPEVVVNCAAWTDVDGCEIDPERAQEANARGPELLARACRKHDTLLITISTDYVFDGEKEGFYTQGDEPNPLSVYGLSKLEGERRAQEVCAATIVVRSGYIFGSGGRNFLSTVLARAQRGQRIRAIHDMFGTPTYAPDLACQIFRLAKLGVPGTYHIVNSGEGASFADFARAAVTGAGLSGSLVEAISLKTLNRPAARPRNSRLRCLFSEAIGLPALRALPEALVEFVNAETSSKSSNSVIGTV